MESAVRAEPVLETCGISKSFGATLANDQISFAVGAGQIHALLGENGAGKSTLVKILYGIQRPDAGEIRRHGRVVRIASPAQARALGIGMVFQHFSLFESFTVAENIALGLDANSDAVRSGNLAAQAERVGATYGLQLNLRAQIADLSAGERQRVEIVRCLLQEPQVLIMDEPTSVLTAQEAEALFVILRRLAAAGCAVIYISHRLEEVRQLCDCATVLRRARVVGQVEPRSETVDSLARLMIGADVGAVGAADKKSAGKVRLQVRALHMAAPSRYGVALRDIELSVAGGQILGIAGIAGNGQDELFAALSGERSCARADSIMLDGKPVGIASINARRRQNAAFIPEQRIGHGAVEQFGLNENIVLSRHATEASLHSAGMLVARAARGICARVRDAFDVRGPAADPAAGALSGGNLQKFIIGRELDRNPAIVVVNQPTWGVDAGSAVLIHQALQRLAGAGAALVIISQDLDELRTIADSIAVIADGALSAPLAVAAATPEVIGALMGGAPAGANAQERSGAH